MLAMSRIMSFASGTNGRRKEKRTLVTPRGRDTLNGAHPLGGGMVCRPCHNPVQVLAPFSHQELPTMPAADEKLAASLKQAKQTPMLFTFVAKSATEGKLLLSKKTVAPK